VYRAPITELIGVSDNFSDLGPRSKPAFPCLVERTARIRLKFEVSAETEQIAEVKSAIVITSFHSTILSDLIRSHLLQSHRSSKDSDHHSKASLVFPKYESKPHVEENEGQMTSSSRV